MGPDFAKLAAEACGRAMEAAGPAPVHHNGPANWLRGWEGVGGWLAMTSQRLVFASHHFNWWTGVLLIETRDILRAELCWSRLFGLVPVLPNGLLVRTAVGRSYRFVVSDRQRWAEVLGCYSAEPTAAPDRGG